MYMSEKEKLLEILKNAGEDQVKAIVEGVFKLAEDCAKASDNKFDDLVLVAVPLLKDLVMKELDKIDNQVG